MKRLPLLLLLLTTVAIGLAFSLVPRPERYYCWLVFGPEGDGRRLACLDDGSLDIDLDGDGRFDGPGEHVAQIDHFREVLVRGIRGPNAYRITSAYDVELEKPRGHVLVLHVEVHGPVSYGQIGDVDMAVDPDAAPSLHFGGPLTVQVKPDRFERADEPLTLKRAGQPTQLYAVVGTMNSAATSLAAIHLFGAGGQPRFARGVHPVADVEFAPKVPGDPRIRARFALDQLC